MTKWPFYMFSYIVSLILLLAVHALLFAVGFSSFSGSAIGGYLITALILAPLTYLALLKFNRQLLRRSK